MIVQCVVCRRIRVNGDFRLPWPGEMREDAGTAETYCPRCARETLRRVQTGEFAMPGARTTPAALLRP